MNSQEAFEYALQHAPRNPDHSIIEGDLVELVADHIELDVAKAKLGLAQRIVARRKRPGQTAAEGVVVLPGMEPYAYEPHRLLADDDGKVIENEEARVRFKTAEARRAQKDALKAANRASREGEEANRFAEWAEKEYANGRPPREITWDNCVRETGLWKDADLEPDDDVAVIDDGEAPDA